MWSWHPSPEPILRVSAGDGEGGRDYLKRAEGAGGAFGAASSFPSVGVAFPRLASSGQHKPALCATSRAVPALTTSNMETPSRFSSSRSSICKEGADCSENPPHSVSDCNTQPEMLPL